MAFNSDAKEHIVYFMVDCCKDELERAGIPLADARVLTLGGQGVQLPIWLKKGFVAQQICVIEAKPKRAASLQADSRFKGCSIISVSLKQVPHYYEQMGSRSGIDIFDCDLSGTIEPRGGELEAIMPLLKQGRARLLSLTLADARRNLSVEEPTRAAAWLIKEFSEMGIVAELEAAWQQLVSMYADPAVTDSTTADALKVAFRELAALARIVLYAAVHGLSMARERPGYRWAYSGDGGFRMRTYLLRFEDGSVSQDTQEYRKQALQSLLEFVQVSKCWYVKGDQATLYHTSSSTTHAHTIPTLREIAGGRPLQMKTDLAPSAASSLPTAAYSLTAQEFERLTNAKTFFGEEVNAAIDRLLTAAQCDDSTRAKIERDAAFLAKSSISAELKAIVAKLAQATAANVRHRHLLLHVPTELPPAFLARLRAVFEALLQETAEAVADELLRFAGKEGMSTEELTMLLAERFEPPPAAPPLAEEVSKPLAEKVSKESGASAHKRDEPRTMTPTLKRKDENKARTLDIYIAVRNKSPEVALVIAAKMIAKLPNAKTTSLRAILARWSGKHRAPCCIAFLAYATSESDFKSRYGRLVQAFGAEELNLLLLKRNKVRIWRERLRSEAALEAWLKAAIQ